jgi:hypothetical protein
MNLSSISHALPPSHCTSRKRRFWASRPEFRSSGTENTIFHTSEGLSRPSARPFNKNYGSLTGKFFQGELRRSVPLNPVQVNWVMGVDARYSLIIVKEGLLTSPQPDPEAKPLTNSVLPAPSVPERRITSPGKEYLERAEARCLVSSGPLDR